MISLSQALNESKSDMESKRAEIGSPNSGGASKPDSMKRAMSRSLKRGTSLSDMMRGDGRSNPGSGKTGVQADSCLNGGRTIEGKLIDDSDEEEEVTAVSYKIILCGDGAVGKTSVATRFTQDHCAKSYKQTIGLDFFIKRLALPGKLDVALQIWDIGGQSIGSRMLSNYIYGADAVLLCYDITNYQSFQNLEDWLRLVRRTFPDKELPYMAVVANKIDLEHIRAVTVEKHNDFADENDFYSYSVSAKSGDNVKGCFHRIAADLAGVVLSRPEFQIAHKVVTAEIVEHEKDDPNVVAPSITDQKQKCIVQ